MTAAIKEGAADGSREVKVHRFNGGYEASESSPFCVVHNEGSESFANAGLGHFFAELDFEGLGRRVLVECGKREDKNRGNYQVNVLFNAGEAHRRNEKELIQDYGVAMPLPDRGTTEWMGVALQLNKVCKRIGIWWLQDSNLTDELRERREVCPRSLHPKLDLEGMTAAAIRLYPEAGEVKAHVDSKNCPLLSEVIIMSQIVWLGEELWRVSLIGYMRKSCMDAMIRRDACKEVSHNTVDYINTNPAFLRPALSVEEHRAYFENIGELGLGLIIHDHPKTGIIIRSAALMTRPHMDKPMGYISGLSSSILKIAKKNPHLGMLEILMMCLPFGQLPGTFVYGNVLAELAAAECVESESPIGPLRLIIDRISTIAGSYSSGRFNRSQPGSTGQTTQTEAILRSGKCLLSLCGQFTEEPDAGNSYAQHCAAVHSTCLSSIKRGCSGVGDFGAQSLVALLAQLGYLKPMGLLHIAHFVPKTATLKKSKKPELIPNPAMRRYLYDKSGLSGVSERARSVMKSVVPHLKTKCPWMTSSIVEQVSCESYRRKKTADFYYPGQNNYYYPFETSLEALQVWEMRPQITFQGITVAKKMRQPLPGKNSMESKLQCHGQTPLLLEGTYHQCRIPFKYIDAFQGLAAEVRAQFFSKQSDMSNVAAWLQGHPVIKGLSEYFLDHDVPLKECCDALNGVAPKTSAKRTRSIKHPSDFAHLSPETYKSCSPHGTSDDNTFSVTYEGSREMWSSSVENGRTVVKSLLSSEKSSLVIQQRNELQSNVEVLARQPKEQAVPFQSERTSDPVQGVSESIVSSGQHESVSVIVAAETIRHYRLLSRDAVGAMHGWKPSGLDTVRKLVQVKKDIYKGSPIHTELKRCLHFPKAEKDMPVDLHKGAFMAKLCTSSTHSFAGPQSQYYVSEWMTNPNLRFFEIGVCSLVDRIAVNLGATKATKRSSANVMNWVYPTSQQSNLHLMQCLVACAGKPGYFKRLMRTVSKQLKEKHKAPSQPSYAVVSVGDRDKKIGSIFNVIMSLEDGAREKWSIAMSPGVVSPGEPRWNSNSLVLDLWSWKDGTKLEAVVDEDLKPAAFAGRVSGPKRSRARKRRRLLKQKLVGAVEEEGTACDFHQVDAFMEDALQGSMSNFITRGVI